MKRKFLLILALFFPWLSMLACDKPGAALTSLFMQITLIGWIPASIWARNEVKNFMPKPVKEKA